MKRQRAVKEDPRERMGKARKLSGWARALPVDLEAAKLGPGSPTPTRMLALGEKELLERPSISSAFADIWRSPSACWGGDGRRVRGGCAWIGETEDLRRVWDETIEIWRGLGAQSLSQAKRDWLREGVEAWTDRSALAEGLWMALSAFDLGEGRSLLALHLSPKISGDLIYRVSRGPELFGTTTKERFGWVGGALRPSLGEALAFGAVRELARWERELASPEDLDEDEEPEGFPKECRAMSDFKRAFGLGDMVGRVRQGQREAVLAGVERALALAQREELGEATATASGRGRSPSPRL